MNFNEFSYIVSKEDPEASSPQIQKIYLLRCKAYAQSQTSL